MSIVAPATTFRDMQVSFQSSFVLIHFLTSAFTSVVEEPTD